MLTAIAFLALFPATQLGWKAGTPEPVLDGNPEYLTLYWKAWENYYETVTEDIRQRILPLRYSSENNVIGFDTTLARGVFAKWGYKAAPIESTLKFLASRIDSKGAAPAFISVIDGASIGEATTPILLPLLALDLYRFDSDKSLARELFAAAARRNLYWNAVYTETTDNGPKKPATHRWRVPRNFSMAPLADAPEGIGDTAEALSLLLIEADSLSKLAKVGEISSGESAYRQVEMLRESALAKTWHEPTGWFCSADKKREAVEPLTLIPCWVMAAGKFLEKSSKLIRALGNPDQFGRWVQYPMYGFGTSGYSANRGVLPINQYLTVRALMASGQRMAAGVSAENMLNCMARSAGTNCTLYSEFGPDTRQPAPNAIADSLDAGIVTIAVLIEALIGMQVDAESNKLHWNIWRLDRHGIKNLRFGKCVVSAICEARDSRAGIPEITVSAEAPFKLVVTIADKTWEKGFPAGDSKWTPGQP